MVHIRTAKRFQALALALSLAFLAACTQGPETGPQVAGPIVATLAIPSEVALVTLTVDGTTHSQSYTGSGTVTFEILDLPLGSTTFVAKAYDAVTDGVLLYEGSTIVDVTSATSTVDLTMSRATRDISVMASSAEVLGPGEVVSATVSGYTQMLQIAGDRLSASGTLVSVPTGRGLVVTVSSHDGATLVRQGTGTLDLSEADGSVTVVLTALGTNQAPDVPVLTGVPAEVTLGELVTLSVAVSDADGNLASVAVQWGDGASESMSVSGAADNAEFTHTYSITGSQTITVTVTDADGLTAQASVAVEVLAPTETDIDVIVDVDSDLSHVTVTATGAPSDATAVTATLTFGNPGETIVMALVPQGSFAWSASLALRQGVPYELEFDAATGGGSVDGASYGFTPDASTYEVTEAFGDVGPTNTPPVAVDDTAQTEEDTPVTIDVLANDSDADGDSLTISGIVTGPANGSAAIVSGSIVYTPGSGFSGSDTFTYSVSDGTDSDTATVTVTVTEVGPTALNIIPMSTTCTAATQIDESCEVSVHLVGNDEDVYGLQFDFAISGGSYAVDVNSSDFVAAFGDYIGVVSDVTAAAAAQLGSDPDLFTGSGEIFTFTVKRVGTGSSELTTSAGILTVDVTTELSGLPGVSLELP